VGIRANILCGALAATLLGNVPLLEAAEASEMSNSKDIVIVPAASLPDFAHQPGIALQLYTESGSGDCYLYIEQNMGERLIVLKVTDPARVKLESRVDLTIPGPFDFVQPLGTSAYLIRFRNNLETGVMDLRHPKAPSIRVLSAVESSRHTETIGDSSAFLLIDEQPLTTPPVPRDYQVYDASNPANPALLATVRQVTYTAAREETGTTFLLGADGLTVLRRPRVEAAYKANESYTN